MRNFRNYQIWQESIKFVSEIYTITKQFPSHERHGLSNQLNRAAVSIASNIAEGSARESEKEFNHFLYISMGSAFEVETQLTIASNLGYISQQNLNVILGKIHIIEKKINELISVIKASYNQPKAKN
jgi:four helix bundle protein